MTLVNDNHADNYLQEILAFVYNGSTVNNRPKNTDVCVCVCVCGRGGGGGGGF